MRSPSYPTVCLLAAAWNAVIVRSLWATAFCVVLGAAFAVTARVARGRRIDPVWLVVGCAAVILLVNAMWFAVRVWGS